MSTDDGVYNLYLQVPEDASDDEVRAALVELARSLSDAPEVNLAVYHGPPRKVSGKPAHHQRVTHVMTMKSSGAPSGKCLPRLELLPLAMICGAKGPEIRDRLAEVEQEIEEIQALTLKQEGM